MLNLCIDTKSILLMATNASNIIGLELRSMKESFRLQTPIHHGTPTCFCMDRRKIWLVVGTSHGIIDMFDLRFLIRVKAWGLPGMTAIHRIALHPSKGRGKWMCVAGGCGQGEITVWDVEKVGPMTRPLGFILTLVIVTMPRGIQGRRRKGFWQRL